MFIILEGPDQIGKTTLTTRLNEMGVASEHRGPPNQHPLMEYVRSLEDEVPGNVVMDRWHLGQYVYPRLYPKDRTPLTDEELLWIELFLLSRGALLATINVPDVSALRSRVAADEDSYLRPEDVSRCVTLFNQAFARSILPTYIASFRSPDSDILLMHRAWQTWYRQAVTTILFPHVIGDTHKPLLMLVGDRTGRPNPEWATHRVPFAPYPSASGRYLMRAIELWGRQLKSRTLLVNAYDSAYDAPTDLWGLWRRVGQPPVVALGGSADEELQRQRVPHGAVPHPQAVRRFRHDRLSEYSRALTRASHDDTHLTMEEL